MREYLYFLADHPARHLPLDQLHALRIGVVRGYTYRSMDDAVDSGQVSTLETSRDHALLDLLVRRRVDAVAMVDELFYDQLAARKLDQQGFTRGAKLSDAPLVIKLQRQHVAQLPRLNAALQALIRSGEIERIRRSYMRVSVSSPGQASVEH